MTTNVQKQIGPIDNSISEIIEWLINAPLEDLWEFMGESGKPVGARTNSIVHMQFNVVSALLAPPKPMGKARLSLKEALKALKPDQEELFWELLERASAPIDVCYERAEYKREKEQELIDWMTALNDEEFVNISRFIETERKKPVCA